MVLEAAVLNVEPGLEHDFEAAFQVASRIMVSMPGYLAHELQRRLEVQNKYLLLVRWRRLEDHMIGFRGSPEYQEWRKLLHHFYDPFPTVEHFSQIDLSPQS